MKPIRLDFALQHYAWGKIGRHSLMRRLNIIDDSSTAIDEPVAEAWAGTHPSAPSRVCGTDRTLIQLIEEESTNVLGEKVEKRFGKKLPFLFKLLSIETPLSIQVHPDQKKAAELHKRAPGKFPETNHKPELGIAVEPRTLLLGFRSPQEIGQFFLRYPELSIFDPGKVGSEEQYLRTLYAKLFQCTQCMEIADELVQSIRKRDALGPEEELFLELHQLYPGDPGVFQVFILNLMTLQRGEGAAIPPNTPHSYISGDLVECMALSDFVIRAGLTPKPKEISALLETVEYASLTPKVTPFLRQQGSQFGRYDTRFEEFQVERALGHVSEEVRCEGPLLYFAFEGRGEILIRGEEPTALSGPDLILVPAETRVHHLSYSGEIFRVTIPPGVSIP